MAGKQPQVAPYTHQQSLDYDDTLEPGYGFRPTDLVLIGYYLKRKIELGEHPRCRIYDVNVYEHHPEELKERFRSCEDKWYYFTKREPKYQTGERVNRLTKKFGHWKSTQKENPVYDFVTRRKVGTKRSLAFHDENKKKTPWLMQEYTYNGTNTNKLTDWVLCVIYKKSTKAKDNSQTDQQVENTRNHDEPSPAKRQRVMLPNQVSETNNQLEANALNTMQPFNAFQDPNQGFAPEQVQSSYRCENYENQSNMLTLENGFRCSSGGSSSSSVSSHPDRPIGDAHNMYCEDSHTLVNMQDAAHKIYEEYESLLENNNDDEGVHTNFTPFDEFMKSTHSTSNQDGQALVNMQSGYNQSMDFVNDDSLDEIISHLYNNDEDV